MGILRFFSVFVVCLIFVAAEKFKSKHLPSYIVACKKANPSEGDCSKNAGNAAIPSLLKGDKEYKIPVLSPLKVPKMELKSGNNLQLTLIDVSVLGLETAKFTKLEIDPKTKHTEVVVSIPWLSVDSQYTIKGQILVLPISGSGPANLTFYDNIYTYTMDYDLIKQNDDKEYMTIKKSNIKLEIPRGYFHLENLFNGNKELANYITPCKKANPNEGDCSKNSGIAAIPFLLKGDKEYKIPVLSPLKVPKLDLKSGENLQLTLTDVTVLGIENAKFEKLSVDPKAQHAEVVVSFPWLTVVSDYTIKGHILVLPITGSGPANLTFYDNTYTYTFDYELYKKNDKKEYARIKKSNIELEISKAYFHLENLFNGNKELGDHMNNFLNENSKDVIKDLGHPVISELVQLVVTQVFSSILKVVPYNEVLV